MKEFVSMSEYEDSKARFYKKHYGQNGFKEFSTVQDNIIRKNVEFEDGASWYEVTMPVWEKVTISKHGITQEVTVNYYRTEVWSTDYPNSRYLYEAGDKK